MVRFYVAAPPNAFVVTALTKKLGIVRPITKDIFGYREFESNIHKTTTKPTRASNRNLFQAEVELADLKKPINHNEMISNSPAEAAEDLGCQLSVSLRACE